jgi:hypothetical protein
LFLVRASDLGEARLHEIGGASIGVSE